MNAMRFRTEIEPIRSPWQISHSDRLLLLGSCFTDEIGTRLGHDGFDVMHNPFGPLFNPESIAACLGHAISRRHYTRADLEVYDGVYHCLHYASRFSGTDADGVLETVNSTMQRLADFIEQKPVVILTLGSAFVYRYQNGENKYTVGNCHKLPASMFSRERLSVDEVNDTLACTVKALNSAGIDRIAFTVSPIRHLADGLHGNNLSKSTLLLGIDRLSVDNPEIIYFPSYEIVLDDLRDYRFYADDLKHPSAMAVDYIYSKFSDTFFNKQTRQAANEARSRYLAAQHRPLL